MATHLTRCQRLGLLVDARDWSALERLFTNPVYSDRTSLFGGEPQNLSPGELVGGLGQVLATSTQPTT